MIIPFLEPSTYNYYTMSLFVVIEVVTVSVTYLLRIMNILLWIFCTLLQTMGMSFIRQKRLVFDMIPKYEYQDEQRPRSSAHNLDLNQMKPKLENNEILSYVDLRNFASLSKRSSDKTERKEKEIQKKQILRQKFEMWKLHNYARKPYSSNCATRFKTDLLVIPLFLMFVSIN